ncbi:MAG: hypothetical protein GXP31_18745 [Kiritimatiellaeota bacterium]|nr:hypothetical protein [Kiritimatiellota bacterium]
MRFVTFRSVAIACALMPILALWVVQAELIWYTGHSTTISLYYHVTFVILLLALANLGVRRLWPGAELSPPEILTIYMMLCIAGTLCSHDLLQIMIPMLTFPEYNANPQNRWQQLILANLPNWAIVTDPEACRQLAVGNASLYSWRMIKAWARPLAFWSIFLVTLMMALLFLNIIFRQPWTEKERLSFPVIQIPLLIASSLPRLLKSRLFWIGFGVAALIDINNGFSFLFPSIPEIPIIRAFEFRDYFVERPWNSIAWTTVNLYPFVIGLTYFLPTDLAFSCWFFFIFFKLEIVLTSALGIRDLPGAPFPVEQSAGGYLALAVFAIWLGRRHLAGVWRSVLGKPGGADESREPVRYRTAVLGFIMCTLVLIALGVQLGATPGILVVFFIIFFLYSLAIARMRAELGPPAHDLHFMGPDILLHNALGTTELGTGNVSTFALFFWFNRAYRSHFSAHSMEGFKLAQTARIRSRSMMIAMIIALLVGLLAAYWALLHALYVHGYSGKTAGDAFAREAWNTMAGRLSFPQKPRIAATVATIIGFLFALLLGFMRTSFTWWVWHPVGFATATCWSMGKIWACLFLGWLAKALITRYGGATAYRKALPLFVGLVLGEFVVGSLWTIYGAVFHTPVYHFWG